MERKLIAVAVASAMGLPMAAHVHADEMEVEPHSHPATYEHAGHEMGDGTMAPLHAHQHEAHPHAQLHTHKSSAYGQVMSTLTKVDDGDAMLGSGNASETRFGFRGSEDLDNGLTAGVLLEVGAGGGAYGYGGQDFRVRHANVSLSSAAGKVTIGQQGNTHSSAAYADAGLSFLGGATNWCSYGIGGGPACATNDSGRGQRVRYDSPALGPVSISASIGNDDFWDAGASVSGSAGNASYDLRVGYNGTSENEDILAGGSVTVGSTGVMVAWSQGEDDDNGDNEYTYVKLDHTYGDGSIGVYYRRGEDDRGEGSLWGVGIGHSLGSGTTAYAGYRIVENDDMDEIDGMLAGIRVQFN